MCLGHSCAANDALKQRKPYRDHLDFIAVFDVLVSYCICFEKLWEKNPQNLKIMCWVFYFRIPYLDSSFLQSKLNVKRL